MSIPDDRQPQPQSDSESIDLARKPSFPLAAILSLVWAGFGPVFMAESDHFGWGFLPSMIWLLSLPIIILLLIGVTIYKIDSYLERRYQRNGALAAIALWPIALFVYVAIGIYVLWAY